MSNFSDINMVIYYDNYPVAVWKPDHLGFIGVYLKNLFLSYPVGTHLKVGFLGHEKNDSDEERIAMIVNKSGFEGTGLRLKSFERDSINKWNTLLSSFTRSLATPKYQ
ncbi:MAG: hypothetical protein OEW99_14270 [Gammaproteobacteria bacterium]|nr:hypothetical protein [Gammaproteobacteria bacterium]MDH5661113.1 hypothetical protein [Gammaproteobacteria bacterium]